MPDDEDLQASAERLAREAEETPAAAAAEAHLVGYNVGSDIVTSFTAWLDEKVQPTIAFVMAKGESPRVVIEPIVAFLRETADTLEGEILDSG